MREFFSPAEFAAASAGEIPADADAFSRYAAKNGWRRDRRLARMAGQGGGWEYHYTQAPIEVQNRLLKINEVPAPVVEPPSKPIWQVFERLPAKAKTEASERLAAVDRVDAMSRGSTRSASVAIVAQELGISSSTLFAWLKLAVNVDRCDRLAELAPHRQGRTATADCDPRAWDFILADYMRASQPAFEPCYRRMLDAAKIEGWSPIPHSKTLKRRLEREVPRAALVAMRSGPEQLKKLYPAQQRDRTWSEPLELVHP